VSYRCKDCRIATVLPTSVLTVTEVTIATVDWVSFCRWYGNWKPALGDYVSFASSLIGMGNSSTVNETKSLKLVISVCWQVDGNMIYRRLHI